MVAGAGQYGRTSRRAWVAADPDTWWAISPLVGDIAPRRWSGLAVSELIVDPSCLGYRLPMPPLHPEAHDSYVSKFIEDFKREVLKAVFEVPSNERRGPSSELMVNQICGDSAVGRRHPATYEVQQDCSIRISFHLEGSEELFGKYCDAFLGQPWKFVKGAAEVHLKGDLEPEKNRLNLVNRQDELDHALRAFILAHTEAKQKLIQLANNSYLERVRLEEVLKEYRIKREEPPVKSKVDDLFGGYPR